MTSIADAEKENSLSVTGRGQETSPAPDSWSFSELKSTSHKDSVRQEIAGVPGTVVSLADLHEGNSAKRYVFNKLAPYQGITDTGPDLKSAVDNAIRAASGKKISRLELSDHGCPGAIQVGDEMVRGSFISERQKTEFRRLGEHMAPDSIIVLRTCYTGSVDGLIKELSALTGTKVAGFTGQSANYFNALEHSYGRMRVATPDGKIQDQNRGVTGRILSKDTLPPEGRPSLEEARRNEGFAQRRESALRPDLKANQILFRTASGEVHEGRLVPVNQGVAPVTDHIYEIAFRDSSGAPVPNITGRMWIGSKEPLSPRDVTQIPAETVAGMGAVIRQGDSEQTFGNTDKLRDSAISGKKLASR